MSVAASNPLRELLLERLGNNADLALSSTITFLDLLWDSDLTSTEVQSLDAAVVVDSTTSGRQLIAQEVRRQLRYWLTTDRDPYALSTSARTQLGSVSDVDELVRLCIEFVADGVPIPRLSSNRVVLRG